MLQEGQRLEKFEKDLRARIAMEQKNWEMRAEQANRQLTQDLETLWQTRAGELEAAAKEKDAEREKAFEEMKSGLMAEIAQKESDLKIAQSKLAEERQQAMAKLNAASGDALDQLFASEMAKHHEMAIKMIDTATLKDPELRKMAEKMKAAQTAELKELQQHAKH